MDYKGDDYGAGGGGGGTDPQTAINTADIIILKSEVLILQAATQENAQDILVINSTIDMIESDLKTNTQDIVDLKADVVTLTMQTASISANLATLDSTVAGLQASSIADFGCLQILCPLNTDNATARTRVINFYSPFYGTGYADYPNNQFVVNNTLGGNFSIANPLTPTGLIYTVPVSVRDTASFEIDISISFIPTVLMNVSLAVYVAGPQFDIFSKFYNERTFAITPGVVKTWSFKSIITLPLQVGGTRAVGISFFAQSYTGNEAPGLEVIYGVGDNFGLNQITVRRLN